jgi:hypothetical protein
MVGQEQFRSYLDESANSPNELYVVGGFIGKTDVWVGLEPLWLESLPPGITTFHATDCFSGNNDFEGVSIADRPELLNKVTDLIARHEIRLIGYGIDAKTYRQIAPKRKNNDFLGNIYAAPLGGAIQLSCEAMGNGPTPDLIWSVLENGEHWEKCGFFIESNEYSTSAARTIADTRRDPDLWFRSRIGTDTYGTKTGPNRIPLLQVGDFGASLAARYIGKPFTAGSRGLTPPRTASTVKRSQEGKFDRQGKAPVYRADAAASHEKLPEGPEWGYEIKLDGYRALAFKTGVRLSLRSRNDNDFALRYPSISKALASLPDDTAVDGEIVALDEAGKPSFNALQNYGSSKADLIYYIFDVMVLAGKDVMAEPLAKRRDLLEKKVLPKLAEPIRYSPALKPALQTLSSP